MLLKPSELARSPCSQTDRPHARQPLRPQPNPLAAAEIAGGVTWKLHLRGLVHTARDGGRADVAGCCCPPCNNGEGALVAPHRAAVSFLLLLALLYLCVRRPDMVCAAILASSACELPNAREWQGSLRTGNDDVGV